MIEKEEVRCEVVLLEIIIKKVNHCRKTVSNECQKLLVSHLIIGNDFVFTIARHIETACLRLN